MIIYGIGGLVYMIKRYMLIKDDLKRFTEVVVNDTISTSDLLLKQGVISVRDSQLDKFNNEVSRYCITGIDRYNKRFKIYTNNPYHYNIYRGTVWYIDGNNRRIKIRYYYN